MNRLKKIMNKLIMIILFVFIFICVFINISFVVTKKINGKATIFGVKPFFIMSESMEGTIKTYQWVVGKPVEADECNINDIIAYKKDNSNKTVIHRIIDINDDGTLVFKGDNNADRDKADIRPDQILYKIFLY